MKTRLYNYISILVKVVIIIIAVFAVETSSRRMESKVENVNLNKTLDLLAMTKATSKEDEEIIKVLVGDLTGYGADCPKCSGRLGCSPYLDVRDGTTTYEDKTYGKVRIVASSRNLKCGSIIRFNSLRVSAEPIIAIVLDRGVVGTSIDLLTESESFAGKYVGRSEIIYSVLRDGWK